MRWVVLLRAVNLGARNKVPMAQLRTLLEDAGYGNVRTYIASGNVVLDGPRSGASVARELERIVTDEFGVDTTAIVRKPAELEALVSDHPFGRDTSRSHVVFLAKRPTAKAAERLAEADHSPDSGVLADKDVYVQYGAGRPERTPLGRAARAAARRGRNASQLADGRRAGRAGRRGVGSSRHQARGEFDGTGQGRYVRGHRRGPNSGAEERDRGG
jgi:uncharacterized protein (DUF1697 family)